MKMLAVSLIAVISALSARAEPVTIIRWWDDYTDGEYGNRYRASNEYPFGNKTLALDLDGDGAEDDSILYWDYSLTVPLTPVPRGGEPAWAAGYRDDKPSAVFYGGLVVRYLNVVYPSATQASVQPDGIEIPPVADARWASNVRRGRGPGSDMTIFAGPDPISQTRWPDGSDPGDDLGNLHALWVWLQQDFVNGGASHSVRFEPGCLLSVDITRYWLSMEPGRFVVRDGDQLYISEFSFTGNNNGLGLTHQVDPTATLWATYDPVGPHDIDFPEGDASFQAHTFQDVTGVGLYFEQDNWVDERIRLVYDNFRVDAVVPEPASCLMLVAVAGAFLKRQCRGANH